MSSASESKMDPTKTLLGRMLLEEVTPLVMVLSTSSVEESCQKNGLTFLQMLLPFCFFNKIDVPVRTASDQPYRLQMFKLRLAYASDIHQQDFEVAKERMEGVVSAASDEALLDLQSSSEFSEKISESRSTPPWFQTLNKEFIRAVSFSEHETFDHPVGCLLVVSSKDSLPVNKFVDLFNTDQLPSLLNDGVMDPKILKYYLLVHDNQDGPIEKANNILGEMRSTFGPGDCHLLCINSGKGNTRESDGNPWISYKSDSSKRQVVGCLLDANDVNEIKDLMQEFTSKHIIPYMEQKIQMLNQQVSATRKGFRNQFKNLWWRKGKEDAPDDPRGPTYVFSSPESQIRVLGDYAFMLRDYELALSNYRLLSTDYKLDKSWKQYAGVQEMSGLSYFMLDQSKKDADNSMETAFNSYMRVGSSCQRNATRCGLWWAEMLKSWGHYKEAATVYLRISSEESSMLAAAMLEQSSYCYLHCSPPLLRKYGFHLVLAGDHYELSDQSKHAIRTYITAFSLYKGGVWKFINDHLNFNIARWYSHHGLFDVAIKHLLDVLACSHQPPHTQESFLKDFYHVVQNLGKTCKVFQLQLPRINMQSINVIFEDHRTYASSSSVLVKESLWHSLEEELVPSMPTFRPNWLDSHSKPSGFKKLKDFAFCVSGEAVIVEVEFVNPLQTPISISAVSLLCELSASSDDSSSDDFASGTVDDNSESLEGKLELDDNNLFTVSKVELSFHGGETAVVQLKVVPMAEGFLNIVGVRWTLSGSVIGYHKFDFGSSKKKFQKRKASCSTLKPILKFVVIKNFPKLDGCVRNLPRKTLTGDLRGLSLELTNNSDYFIKNLKMMISHPQNLYPASVKDMVMDFPACLQRQSYLKTDDSHISIVNKQNGLLVLFSEDITIQSDASFCWPLWFHTGLSGSMTLYISIYYEVDNCSSEMKYRTLRLHHEIEVLSSLDMSVHMTPFPSRIQEFLVRMDIINMTASDSFCLHQLSIVQNQWNISPLLPDAAICPSNVVIAGQALSCFFKVQENSKNSGTDNSLTSLHNLKGSDLLLDPQKVHESAIRVSCSPFIDFLNQESMQQSKLMVSEKDILYKIIVGLNQESSNAIDFILLSAPEESGGSFDPTSSLNMSQLLSHHSHLSSIVNVCPIWWEVDGPKILQHDFFSTFCVINFCMSIQNCANVIADVKINTADYMRSIDVSGIQSNEVSSGGNKSFVGWHDVAVTNEISDFLGPDDIMDGRSPPFVWSGSSSTRITLDPSSKAEVPLRICVFAPGTYNLSNYSLQWSLQLQDDQLLVAGDAIQSSGTKQGYPFYLTVLQSV